MDTWADRQLDLIGGRFPNWDCWVVRRIGLPLLWCARPKGWPVATINSDSLADFIAQLQAASGSRNGCPV